MHFTIAVIVCLGYFLSPVWSNGLNENQLKVMIRLYADLKVPDNKDADHEITKVMTESFGIKQPTTVFKYDSKTHNHVNLHNLLMVLSKQDNESSDKFKVKKLTLFDVSHYLFQFMIHPQFNEQLGYLTLQQLSGVLIDLKLYKSSNGDDNEINEAEFLMIVLKITPKGDGLTLEKIKKFVDLYEVRKTVSGNIDLSACQKVFEDIDITSKQDDLNLLLNSKRPFAKVLIDLMIIAAECSQTLEENESRLFSPGEVLMFIRVFNLYDENLDGLLSDDEYDIFVVQLKKFLKKMEGRVKDSLTFEKAQDFLKKSDGSQSIEGKKVLNFAEFLEIILVYTTNSNEEEEEEEDD